MQLDTLSIAISAILSIAAFGFSIYPIRARAKAERENVESSRRQATYVELLTLINTFNQEVSVRNAIINKTRHEIRQSRFKNKPEVPRRRNNFYSLAGSPNLQTHKRNVDQNDLVNNAANRISRCDALREEIFQRYSEIKIRSDIPVIRQAQRLLKMIDSMNNQPFGKKGRKDVADQSREAMAHAVNQFCNCARDELGFDQYKFEKSPGLFT